MAFLAVAVAVLAALVLVDLVLTGAVIRRLRDTEARLSEFLEPPSDGMQPGESLPEFTAAEADLSRADLLGKPTLLAFFSASCRHCPAQAEQLALHADETASGGVTIVSVLRVADGETDELSPLLRKSGRLVAGPSSAALMTAFRAQATPSFLLFDRSGVLQRRGHSVDEVLGSS